MKSGTFVIAFFCIMVVLLQSSMFVSANMGHIKFRIFKDVDGDKVFDKNESSPPWAVIDLKKQGGLNKVKFIVLSGHVTYRFVLYPSDYHLYVDYFYDPIGLGVDDWSYNSTLRLDAENMGSTIYVPLTLRYTPGP